MTYDGLSRLKTAQSCSFGAGCQFTYDYDALDNLTRVQSPGGIDRYYCYDARQQLTNLKSGPCTSGASVVGLGYDERGNLANKNGQAYVFDYGNRLREVTNKEGYRYDGLGRRVTAWQPTSGTVTVSQYSQAGQLFYDENTSTVLRNEYVYLSGSLLAKRETVWSATGATTVKYQHTDALGTPVAETDAAGAVIQRSEYDPYGRLNNRPLTNGPGYTGHYQDAATGLTYMQQRYYDPTIGRFLSMDPVTADANTGGNFNRYWYANNNPYRFTDPDGRETREMAYERGSGGKLPVKSPKDWLHKPLGYALGGILAAPIAAEAYLAAAAYPAAAATVTNVAAEASGVTGTAAAGATLLSRNPYVVRILENDRGVVEIVGQGAKGSITVVASVVKEGSKLILNGAHVDGLGKGTSSIRELRQLARALGELQGAESVVIKGVCQNYWCESG
ncbi:RHS repeat-associated core domain-containing protein [Luteimonas gilva]|uniref:RHS repeat-associated core domain-containing protein n=2 Tax=Luteimonas gilva TaxID=2572684 RepID=A0A4U5JX78_9GAMM|nr:RHS repeat-associated core domain-containing protein [Luteimonas gilva]